MAIANIYLTFNGNCEKAFRFYESVFGSELSIMRYKDAPSQQGMPSMDDRMGERILHSTLPLSKETSIMGSDTGPETHDLFQQGNNFSISLGTHSAEEARRIFQALSEDGDVIMPLGKTFWTELFGMVTDKFGISWMVNLEARETGME